MLRLVGILICWSYFFFADQSHYVGRFGSNLLNASPSLFSTLVCIPRILINVVGSLLRDDIEYSGFLGYSESFVSKVGFPLLLLVRFGLGTCILH